MKSKSFPPAALILAAFAVLFSVLTVSSYTMMSATWDEPGHLTSGYMALRCGDYRFGLSGHPALLRMWAALPLLAMPDVRLDAASPSYRQGDTINTTTQFLYLDNDADRLLYRARFMTVILGIILGMMLFTWARELYGLGTAAAVLALYTFEPNILAHAGLVTTDVGTTLFFFGTVYFLWRSAGRLTPGNALGLCAFFALAMVSKVSSLILAPMMGLFLVLRAMSPRAWPVGGSRPPIASRSRRLLLGAGLLLAAALAAWVVIWGVYRFRWDLAADPGLHNEFEDHANMAKANVDPGLRRVIEGFDRLRLLPRAYTRGFILQLGERQEIRLFGGVFQESNLWYFYPAALLLKTPISVILLVLVGVAAACLNRWMDWKDRAFLLAPPGAYLLVAMVYPLNTGVRHLLPMYPFLLLAAGGAVRYLLQGRRRWVLVLLGLLLAAEFYLIYPDYLASFNLAAGGPGKGEKWMVGSNLDWGQGLKGLGRWMEERKVPWINLCYFGTAYPGEYGIEANFLPGSQFYGRDEPRLPGYFAVSLTCLYGQYMVGEIDDFYRPLRERKPLAVIRRSINVYWVDSPWWETPGGGGARPDAAAFLDRTAPDVILKAGLSAPNASCAPTLPPHPDS